MAFVERTAGRVWIPGAETESWGCGGGPQNSVMAVLALTMRLMGEPGYDFDFLMGVSGAAFRIHLWVDAEHGSCPSSPHAMVGSNCSSHAFAAVPFEMEQIEPAKEDPEAVRQAFGRVRERVEAGVPVMSFSEETDLIVGYIPGTDILLARLYWDAAPGLREVDRLPWFMMAPAHRRTSKPTSELVRDSIRFACENMETGRFGAYASGWTAFAEWRRRLAEHEWVESLSPEDHSGWRHTNGFIYWSLIEARTAAVNYLRRVAPQLEPKAAAHLSRAAELYDREVREVLRSPNEHAIAPMSWLAKPGEAWPREQRQLQIGKLCAAEEYEHRAIDELECAVSAM